MCQYIVQYLFEGRDRGNFMNTDITKQMEMVLYRTEDDNVTVSALIKDETIWITQKAMAELFGVQTPAISKHLKNIFEQGELREEVVVSKMEIPTPHGAIPGKTQLSPTNYYNLDMVISVGYRVKSQRGVQFRLWASAILKEYMRNKVDKGLRKFYKSQNQVLTKGQIQNLISKI